MQKKILQLFFITRGRAGNSGCRQLRALSGCLGFGLVCLGLIVSGCQFPRAQPNPSSTDREAGRATPPRVTKLKAGDSVSLEFPGAPSLNGSHKVRRDGHITLNMVGDFPVSGLSPEELKKKLTLAYQQQLQVSEVHVSVISQATVYVSGAVLNPGEIQLDRSLSALEAIMASGGFDPQTALVDQVTVLRHVNGERKSFRLNLEDDLKGHVSKPFYLEPFDIVYVTARQVFNPR